LDKFLIIFAVYSLYYKVEEDEVGWTYGTDGREEKRVYVIDRKARGKDTTRKTET
jgi:hypothetical protein